MELTVNKIAEFTGGNLLTKDGEMLIQDCVIDSRKAKSNSLFVPFKGENVDGYAYIKDAVKNGSKCIIIEDEVYLDENLNCQFVLVKNSQLALQRLAEKYRETLNTFVIGITGSNGKTTTKDLVASVARYKGNTLKTLGNYNNELGLPLTILGCEKEHQIAVLEMGMSQLGEIDLLSKISKPQIGIITNIGESHLEHLKTKDNILKAKSEIFNHMSSEGTAIICGDDHLLKGIGDKLPNKITYGLSQGNDLQATLINSYSDKTTFTVTGLGYNFSATIPLLGEHNVINSLAAVAVGHILEIEEVDIIEGLKNPEMTSMRTEILHLNNSIVVIDDCYNASETSTLAGLKVLEKYNGVNTNGGRKIAILGDMLELGFYSNTAHINVGAAAAEIGIDVIVAVGEFREYILKGAKDKKFNGLLKSYDKSSNAAKDIHELILKGDTILVKGSRGVKMEQIVARIKEEF